MKLALAVPYLTADLAANRAEIARLTCEAALGGAALVLFSETALTGFVHTGDPAHDELLAAAIPGPLTDQLAALAREHSIHLALGLLEKSGAAFYDAAILIDPTGSILLHYRRISATWHAHADDPNIYRTGDTIPVAQTALGKLAFLICGDITFDELTDQVQALAPDLLLYPLARGFDDDVHDEAEWNTREIAYYGERVARIAVPTLLVNYVGALDNYIGGAVAYAADGTPIASQPIHQPGILLVDWPLGQ